MEHLREGRSSGDWGLHYSKNASMDSRIEAAILASEISNLEDLEGYFQTPGYTLKLRFPYTPALNHQPAFIRGYVEDVYLRKPGEASGQEAMALTDKAGQQEPNVIRHPELKDGASARQSGETQGLLEMN